MNKITDRYRVFKPVSLSAFQIGADSGMHIIPKCITKTLKNLVKQAIESI
jgi:hypothetical protein